MISKLTNNIPQHCVRIKEIVFVHNLYVLLGAGTCNLDRWLEGVWIPVRAKKKCFWTKMKATMRSLICDEIENRTWDYD